MINNKLKIIIFIILLLFLTIDYFVHQKFKQKILKDLPPRLLAPVDENIELPMVNKNSEINTIYRTYYDLNIAQKFKKAVDITSQSNPKLKQVVYDDRMVDDFVKENYSSRIYTAFNNINSNYGPAKADFFRYLIIYKYGGVYLDMKSLLNKNIDEEIKENKLIVSKGRPPSLYPFSFGMRAQYINNYDWSELSGIKYGEFNNWHFISPAGNEVLGEVIKQVVANIEYGVKNKNKYNNGEYSVLMLTGPVMFARVINKYGNVNNCKILEPRLNRKAEYNTPGVEHKKVGNKNHYSLNKDKNILI